MATSQTFATHRQVRDFTDALTVLGIGYVVHDLTVVTAGIRTK